MCQGQDERLRDGWVVTMVPGLFRQETFVGWEAVGHQRTGSSSVWAHVSPGLSQIPSLSCYLREMWLQTLTCSLLWDRDSPADARADPGVDQEPGAQDLLYCHLLQGPTCKRLNCRACGRRPLWEASAVGGVPCARHPMRGVSLLGTPWEACFPQGSAQQVPLPCPVDGTGHSSPASVVN